MRFANLLSAAAAASLLATPVLAADTSASKLSLNGDVRAGKTMSNASNQESDSSGYIIAAAAAAAVIVGVVLIADGDDDEDSASN